MELIVRIKKFLRDFTPDVDFTARDEIFALLGASGCGKSMTLKSIAGMQPQTKPAEVFKLYGAAIPVSHNRGEVRRLADKVAVMRDGKIDSLGTVHEVFTRSKKFYRHSRPRT